MCLIKESIEIQSQKAVITVDKNKPFKGKKVLGFAVPYIYFHKTINFILFFSSLFFSTYRFSFLSMCLVPLSLDCLQLLIYGGLMSSQFSVIFYLLRLL